jgi:preprotein translocase subunit YajC
VLSFLLILTKHTFQLNRPQRAAGKEEEQHNNKKDGDKNID